MLNLSTKLCFSLVLLLSAGAAWAGEAAEAEALPAAVQSLIEKATQDVAKERAKYDAAAKKLTDKLAADLKAQVEKATKAGNLKLALAVQAKLDEVAKGEVVEKVDEQAKSGDILGENNVKQSSLDGLWKISYRNNHTRTVEIKGKTYSILQSSFSAPPPRTIEYDKKSKRYYILVDGLVEVISRKNDLEIEIGRFEGFADYASIKDFGAPAMSAIGRLEKQEK